AACAAGVLRVCWLRIGGAAAAVQLAAEWGGRFWLLKIGYDERFARCSPGMLLTLETIRHAARAGLDAYEFLGAVEPWTQMWTRHARAYVSLPAYPASPGGAGALVADAARLTWRRVGRFL